MRMGMWYLFVRMARKNCKLTFKYEQDLESCEKNKSGKVQEEIDYEKFQIESKLDDCIACSIVFSSLALEAYIYDYAARNLGDNYVKEHLDKLDVVSKWIIVPKIITGNEIQKSEEGYSLLKKLIRTRNTIVHNKTIKIDILDQEKLAKDLFDKEKEYLEVAKNSIKTLDKLAKEIERIDPNERATMYLGESDEEI